MMEEDLVLQTTFYNEIQKKGYNINTDAIEIQGKCP